MDQALVKALRARGVDLMTTAEAGLVGYTDCEQLHWAAANGRVLYSFNKADFSILHNEFMSNGTTHAGIILFQQRQYSVGAQMRRLLNLIASRTAEELQNTVVYLSAWS